MLSTKASQTSGNDFECKFVCGVLYFYDLFLKTMSVFQRSVTAAWFPHASNKDVTLPHSRKGPGPVKMSV